MYAPPHYATTTAKADVDTETANVKASNNLLNFLIYPPFKRFFIKNEVQQHRNRESTGYLGYY